MRVALLELGRRMAALGHLREPKQVFMLTNDELDAFLADPGLVPAVLARARGGLGARSPTSSRPTSSRATRASRRCRRLRPKASIASSRPSPATCSPARPGARAWRQGPARIITDPGDPFALEPGDVLIAPQTDPSWTPLFIPAAAVVVDVGAMNSHAIIVSRELGIPCAVSVTDAAKRIPDGAMVEVDGAAGTVRLL